jgi:class 3 adenylate cyclase
MSVMCWPTATTSSATASTSPRVWRASPSPAAICLSAAAYEQVRGKLELAVADMGEQDLKNIARSLRTYRVVL